MPLRSPPTQAAPALARASSLPRRLSFATDTDAHFTDAMKSVHQYLRGHLPAEQLAMLGVNDTRSRSNFDDIQQFLARHRSSQQLQQQSAHTQQQHSQHEHSRPRRDSSALLLQDLDAFLDELDPALFGTDVRAAAAFPLSQSPESRLKRPCSYIHEMQARAFAAKRSRSALVME
ncbi:hypothetical protein PybrP1_008025 [[Pythium] brassicae (nom. inval.)]|nr:hypothetical protein PybrP1_008025 [[Pythium] brassicae (nom. inval.)]